MLARISVRNFRSLERVDWRPSPGSHLLVGSNGAGKTSLLEAIYVAATSRSFRTSRLEECVRKGAGGLSVEVETAGDRRTSLRVTLAGGERSRRLNGKPATLADYLAALPVVAWTAESLEVVSGAPAARRRFLDQGVVSSRPAAIVALSTYRRALEQKRAALASGQPIDIWNEMLATAAADLIVLRRSYVVELAGAVEAVVARSGLPFADLQLNYRPSPATGLEGATEVARTLHEREAEERRLGRPVVGPHRDELVFSWRGRGARRMVSAGERKALGLALTAARGDLLSARGRVPVYLLDDADSELDEPNLRAVWRAFEGTEQVIVSSTRPEAWSALGVGEIWQLDGGALALRAVSGDSQKKDL